MQTSVLRTGATELLSLPTGGSASAFQARTAPTIPRIAFLFNAQAHQILHGITVAEQLALGWQANVDILSPAEGHLALARQLTDRASHCLLRFDLIGSPALRRAARAIGSVIPPKLLTLADARRRLNSYDAVALPERTSTIMRNLGVRRPRLIHLDHGAGDRAAGFDPRIARFDFALVAGDKQRRRMLEERLIRPGEHAVVGYPKFEAADRSRGDDRWSPFADDRPIILYNPHFSAELGSWERHGAEIVRQIAADGRFNLIVAPHVRLCDNRKRRAAFLRAIGDAADLPNVHVDPGSDRSIDMSYTMLADLYIGDVSSQIYEFLRRPRPCLFVNGKGRSWRNDPDYAHWYYGPVIDEVAGFCGAIDRCFATHRSYLTEQRRGFANTFDLSDARSYSERAAAAIADYLDLQPRF